MKLDQLMILFTGNFYWKNFLTIMKSLWFLTLLKMYTGTNSFEDVHWDDQHSVQKVTGRTI